MAITEGLVFDGLDLNAGNYTLESFNPDNPKRRPEWAQGGDVDGALLPRDPLFDNREPTARVRVNQQSTMDLAIAAIGALEDRIQEASRNPGGTGLVWTPANSSKSFTMYVLLAEIDGGLPIEAQGDNAGYLLRSPVFPTLKFTCKPFGYAAEIGGTVLDDFSTDTIGAGVYTFDSGSGTIAVSGGQLVPSTTADKQFYRAGVTYGDCQLTMKFTTGASVTGGEIYLLAARLDAANYLFGRLILNGASSSLQLGKVDGGALSTFAGGGSSSFSPAASTPYWLRLRDEGNKTTVEIWTAAPTPTGSPLTSATFTLTGGDATKFGLGIVGNVGMRVRFTAGTDWRIDDFTIDPNVFVERVDPLMRFALPNVPGDVPAEARLQLTDLAGKDRQHFEWGIEQRYADLTQSLLIDSEDLVTAGFQGAQANVLAGSYQRAGAANKTVSATLTPIPVAVCGTGNLGHVGTFRAKARVYATTVGPLQTVKLRFSYQEGDGPFYSLPYVAPVAVNGFSEVDLGAVSIPVKAGGTQRWSGKIEAFTTATGDKLDVDYVELIPAGEGWGKGRSQVAFESLTSFATRDEFNQTVGALNGKTASIGGNWTSTGANDFQVETTGATAQKASSDINVTANSVLGAAQAAQIVQCDVKLASVPTGSAAASGIVARYISGTQLVTLVFGYLTGGPTGTPQGWQYRLLITDTPNGINANYPVSFTPTPGAWYTLRLAIDAMGRFAAWVFPQGTANPSPVIVGAHASLAAAGGLPSGKGGLYDSNGGAAYQRNWDNFLTGTPAALAALFSGRQAEVRSDSAVRQDASGTYMGAVQPYRGSRLYVPPAGSANRIARLAVKGRRNDVDTVTDDQIADGLQAKVFLTPRYLVIPR